MMNRFKGDKNSVQKPRLNVVVIFPCTFLPPDVVNSKNMTSVVKKMFLCNLDDQITHYHAIGRSSRQYRSISIRFSSTTDIMASMVQVQGVVKIY